MTSTEADLFDKVRIPPELDAYVRSTNPWWEGKPGRVLPVFRRWAFASLVRRLETKLAPAIVLRGARQVGKTTLQEQIIEHLLKERGVEPRRILRVQFDEIPSLTGLKQPLLTIADWFQNRILERTLNETAHAGKPAFVFLDEAQNVADWAQQLKALVDHHTVRVVVTGSSALRIEAGRDSLAGRISTLELGTLLLREISEMRFALPMKPALAQNGLEPLTRAEFWRELAEHGAASSSARDAAFEAFSQRGGYPIVQANPNVPWPEAADQLNETVIRRVIQHDLRMGERGRKRDAALLEEIFRLACRYAGQAPSQAVFLTEVRQALGANVGPQRITSYLRFLDGALLIKLIRPLEIRLKRRKGHAKVCIVDHGLRASWLEEVIPLHVQGLASAPHLSDMAGHLAESVVGAFLSGLPHLDLAHFPERPVEPEVDFVLTIGENRIPLEVKYRERVDGQRDTIGLRAFIEKTHYNAPFGVLVTMHDDLKVPDPRIVPISLPSLLLMR
jgi:predicted AAA+ superfamily ATPase